MSPLLALLLLAPLALAQDEPYCLARDSYPYLYFGPKTAYERVYDHKDSPQNVPACRPAGVWMLARGGTSYPEAATLARLHETLGPLRDLVLQNAVEAGPEDEVDSLPQVQAPDYRSRGSRRRANPSPWPRRHCRPLALWSMGRPGTRFPDAETIRRMQALDGLKQNILRNHQVSHGGRLCPEDLAALARWHLNVTEDRALWLTGQGQADLSFLARRLKRRLPELFNTPYSPDKFKFRYTSAQRTQESAEAFASGLFDRNEVELPKPVDNDPLLQFDELCPAWRADRPRALQEVEIFESGPEMLQTVARVSRRLGFNYNLSMEKIDLMWEMCRYDKAWKYVSLSPWCSAFTEDDLKVMEYRADLQYYYSYSYGNELNVKLGCPPVKDMMDHFSRMEMAADSKYESVAPPVGVFYFTHDAALHMMLAALGVAHDDVPLLASNMDQQAKREFRTSFIGSFAANLAAVFYQCDKGERHRVMFYLRERIVDMEGCQVGLCSWNHLRTKLAKATNGCDLKFCNASSAAGTIAVAWSAASAALLGLAALGWRSLV